jgi:NhaP-type Na+/H+ or K+/H+ antiporter
VTPDAIYLVVGLALLLSVMLPGLVRHVAISPPLVLVGVGLLLGLLPMPDGLDLDPEANQSAILHLTEVAVLVALMGVGLALDRGIVLRSFASWARWSAVWRLLLVTMPLTIAGVALLGVGVLGLAPAVAVLLGAVLSPTDPVLASDVQVGEPETGEPDDEDEEVDEHEEIRFALTAEAGLNDALAFPFVHLALLLAAGGFGVAEAGEWVGWYVLGKVAIGAVTGIAVGWALGRLAFRARRHPIRLAEQGEPLLAVAALLMSYGATELLSGYGFLAVFACAMALRAGERRHDYHREMHGVVERLERLFTLAVLLLLGIAMTNGLLDHLDWRGVAVGVVLVFVIRPVTAWLSLSVLARDRDAVGGLEPSERWATAFFGVRGVGSLFYVAYAVSHHEFDSEPWLWSTVAFTIVLSVVVHGIAATPVMKRLDDRRELVSGGRS